MKPALVAACAALLASLSFSTHAAAAGDAAPKTGFVTMLDQGQQWLLAATAGPTAASDPTANRAEQPKADVGVTSEAPQPFLALTPRASLVARDWRGSLQVLGTHAILIDDLRPTASNRMVVGRMATAGSHLSLFAQLGVGQWRVDTVMFPNALGDEALAAQAGAGFQLAITSKMRLAGEVDYTMLYRNLHYAENEVAPRMTSFVFAFAGSF